MANLSQEDHIMATDDDFESLLLVFKILSYVVNAADAGTMLLSIFGILSNIVIILLFLKDGLATSSNKSFFCLALTDLYICIYWMLQVIAGYVGAYPELRIGCKEYSCYKRFINFVIFYMQESADAMNSVGAWITVIITTERLCCIAIPMKVSFLFVCVGC